MRARIGWTSACAIALTAGLAVSCKGDGARGGSAADIADSGATGERLSRTFTSKADFAEGTTDGLNTDSAGELQMSAGLALYETPFVWIPNSNERTVSKIDTRTLELLGTFPLQGEGEPEDCWNPSRTTVDIEGNVWVGCRGTSSYVNSTSGKDVPQEVDHKVIKLAKEDGHVMLTVNVGNGPRALALDANNHLWIGCSVDDTIWEIDGDTGECYRGDGAGCANGAIAVEDFPYGNAVDQRGHLWVVHNKIPTRDQDTVTEIDTGDGSIIDVYGPYLRGDCDDLYGIAIDQLGDVWLGGFSCDDVVKVKGVAGKYIGDGKEYAAGDMIGAYDCGGTLTRGVAVDLDGNVWAAMSSTNTANKLNGLSGDLMQTVNVGSSPIGVGVDAYGNAWVVNRGSDSVHRINGVDAQQKAMVQVGDGPYTYSDMLGTALRTITHRSEGFSSWKTTIDSGVSNPKWEGVNWTASQPPNTQLKVRVRSASTEAGLATTPWSDFIAEPGPVTFPGSGQFAEVEVRFYATSTTSSPVLYDLTVTWAKR